MHTDFSTPVSCLQENLNFYSETQIRLLVRVSVTSIASQVPRPTRLRQQRHFRSNVLHLRAIDQQIPTLRVSTDILRRINSLHGTAAHRTLMHGWANTANGRILK